MNITIQRIMLTNFKAIDSLIIDMDGLNHRIYGDNGVGKTTIADAFHWCLFDKDSSGKTTFDIKPIRDGEPVHLLETSVSLLLMIDGEELGLRKVLRERWVTKRGDAEATFSGHETLYWVNDVPVKAGEYKAKIAERIDEPTFRRMTSPDYFVGLNTKDMRRVLVDMVGEITPDQVAGDDKRLQKIVRLMTEKRYTPDDLAKVVRGQIATANQEIKAIPARIDEVKRSIPASENWSEVEANRAEIEAQIKELELSLVSARHAAQSAAKVQQEMYSLRDQAQRHIRELARSANDDYLQHIEAVQIHERTIRRLTKEIADAEADHSMILSKVYGWRNEIESMRDKYLDTQKQLGEVRAEVWPGLGEDQERCYACGQKLPQDEIELLADKADRDFEVRRTDRINAIEDSLAKITETGQQLRKRIEANEIELLALADKKRQLEAELEAEQAVLDTLNKIEVREAKPEDFADNAEYKRLMAEADKLQEALANPDDQSSLLIEKKANLTAELQDIDKVLARRDQIEAGEKRMQELANRNRELADLVARYEGVRFDLERFIRKQAELLESKINALFSYIQFRLFKVNINGGIEDDCEPLVNGVPYSTGASNSERIRAGLDIVRTMQRQAGIYAPVIVDNAESATWLLPMECQVIQLIVSKPDKELRIEAEGEDDAKPVRKRRADQVA